MLLTRAALGLAGPWSALSRSDPERVALLDEALDELPEDDSPLRARLLARTSLELYYAGEPELRLSLSARRRCGSRAASATRGTLAACLDARHYALWRPENVEERLAVAAELRGVAEETGDPELELQGAGWTIIDLMELGDIDGVDIQIAAVSKLADALHRPIWLWWTWLFRGTRAQLDGRFDEAERLAQETLAIGQRGQAENALHYYAQAMFSIRREQGRLAEVEGAVRNFIELYPAIPAWRCALALLLIELGRPDEARAEFEAVAAARLRLPARRELADRDHADGRGLRRAGRRRAGRRSSTRCSRPTRAATSSSAATRPSTAPPRGCWACWPPRRAATTWPSALRGRAGDARGDGRPALRGAHEGRLGGDAARARRRRRARGRAARRRHRRRRRARDGRAGRAGPAARARPAA